MKKCFAALRSLATDRGALNSVFFCNFAHLSAARLTDQLVSQHNQAAAPPSPESSKELGMNSRNSPAPSSAISSSTSTGEAKWRCLVCTYENFRSAGACVLCGTRKGRSSPDHPQGVQPEDAARDSPSPEVNTLCLLLIAVLFNVFLTPCLSPFRWRWRETY